jgi:CRP-like cAMP-binding protein
MSNDERLRILGATRELAGLRPGRLRNLLPFVDERYVAAGTEIAVEGRLCHELVIVAAGYLETSGQAGTGRLGPGDTLGWHAMWNRGRNDATVVAGSESRLLVMSHQQFRAVQALS